MIKELGLSSLPSYDLCKAKSINIIYLYPNLSTKVRDIHKQILELLRTGGGCALATIVRASGSTPQKPGSSALFSEQGLKAGTVGGGLLESEVQIITESLLISGVSDQFYFNLDSDRDSDGAICGGEAEVLIDAAPADHLEVFEKMEGSLAKRTEGFLFTLASSLEDKGRSIRRYWLTGTSHEDLPLSLEPELKKQVAEQLKNARRMGFVEIELTDTSQHTGFAYLEHIKPMSRLIIAGGGHIGQALAHLASLLEFEVTVVDDRPEFANPGLIPDADHFVARDMGPAMSDIEYGPDTYVVIVTRGHRQDGEALKACIGTEAAYIGMIGSSNKVGVMKKQFIEEQWASREQWASVHTPIGLDIGSQTVQEIAISIAAQLVEVRNRKTLKDA